MIARRFGSNHSYHEEPLVSCFFVAIVVLFALLVCFCLHTALHAIDYVTRLLQARWSLQYVEFDSYLGRRPPRHRGYLASGQAAQLLLRQLPYIKASDPCRTVGCKVPLDTYRSFYKRPVTNNCAIARIVYRANVVLA